MLRTVLFVAYYIDLRIWVTVGRLLAPGATVADLSVRLRRISRSRINRVGPARPTMATAAGNRPMQIWFSP